MSIPLSSTTTHNCGGSVLTDSADSMQYDHCDSCGAFVFEGGDLPSGVDAKANREAWDNADLASPESPEVAEVHAAGAAEHERIMRGMKVEESVRADSADVAKHHGTTRSQILQVWTRLLRRGLVKTGRVDGVRHVIRTGKRS